VAPLIGIGVCVWLMTNLDWKALTMGGIWLVIGIGYLAYLTRGFTVAPPEMDFTEQEEIAPAEQAVPAAGATA
jgi:hypothetical protein